MSGNMNIQYATEPTHGYPVKDTCNQLPDKHWNVPEQYFDIDLWDYFYNLALPHGEEAINRADTELALYEEKGFTDVLRLMMYIRDELNKKGIVWGVGRGSSVSSYLLYLMGIHMIDSLKYGLDIHEFLKD